jgi:hypothetical protein
MVLSVTVIYHVENWRGERAWLFCKRQLESKGQKMDWTAWVPAPVPDSENFFEAPRVKDWFTTRHPNDFTRRLSAENANLVGALSNGPVLAHVSILSPGTESSPGQADLVLRLVSSGKSGFLLEQSDAVATNTPPASDHADQPIPTANWTGHEIYPIISFDDVPFQDAIKNLARQGGFVCVLHPELFRPRTDSDDPPALPFVTRRFENVTLEQALVAILNQHGFDLIYTKRKSTYLVRLKPPLAPEVFASPGVRESLEQLLSRAVGRASGGPQGGILLAQGVEQVKSVRIALQTERYPSGDEVVKIIPGLLLGPAALSPVRLSAQPVGDGYDLFFAERPYTASGYLKWSEQFDLDLDALRDALKRPAARLPGEYRDALTVPRLNFVTVGVLAQMIGQRAKANLLLGQPEAALDELSLLHNLRRPLEAKPVGLISAMMDVSLAGMYEDIVADGLRLGEWREPQLSRIQKQLEEIDLPPLVAEGLQFERAVCLHTMALLPAQLWQLRYGESKTNSWPKLANPTLLAARVAPRGWLRNNMVLAAQLEQMSIDTYEPTRHLIMPAKSEGASRCMDEALHRWSARTWLAGMLVPDFSRAWITASRSQTMAKEALIACALERYRLSRGHLPEQLDELTPRLLDSVPRDVISGNPFRYRRLEGSQFLLYSPGWNQVDEGGEPPPLANRLTDFSRGDWAWRPGEG